VRPPPRCEAPTSSGGSPQRFPFPREEFVFAKLRREEHEEGLYVLRWSVLDFDRVILAVAKRDHQEVLQPSHIGGSWDLEICWFWGSV